MVEASPSGIEGGSVDYIEFARSHTLLSPGAEELPVLVELHDPCIGGRTATAVSVPDKDVAVGRDGYVGWLIEFVYAWSGDIFCRGSITPSRLG
jgi:hypothetical protein